MSFSIWFLSSNDGLFYLIMKNVYPAPIVGFKLRLIIIPNKKLHTIVFCKLFCLILTFLLPLSYNFQLSLPSFRKLLPNPHKIIVTRQLVLKSLMMFHALDLLYYTSAKMVAIDETIAAVILKFKAKALDN